MERDVAMPDDLQLKACPFCGGEPTAYDDGKHWHWITCEGCSAHSGNYIVAEGAARAWNSRPSPEEPTEAGVLQETLINLERVESELEAVKRRLLEHLDKTG